MSRIIDEDDQALYRNNIKLNATRKAIPGDGTQLCYQNKFESCRLP